VKDVRFCIKLVQIDGIDIRLHFSWFFLAILLTLSFANHFRIAMPGWGGASVWWSAIAVTLLFLISLTLHELAHSLVAQRRGVRIEAITLFVMGGISQMKSEPSDAKSDFWIALAGPLASITLGACSLGALHLIGRALLPEPNTPLPSVLLWTGWLNLSLAAFNMLPSYPLDGGRVLRAIIWWIGGDAAKSRRVTSKIGLIIAVLLIAFGMVNFLINQNLDGVWLILLGWILLDTSRAIYSELSLMEELRDQRVADLMDQNYSVVESYISLVDLAEKYLIGTGSNYFVVLQDSKPVGFLTRRDVKGVLPHLWPQTSVQSIMHSLDKINSVLPETPVCQALEIMSRNNIDQLPVMVNGKLEGIFSRLNISRVRRNGELCEQAPKRST
jgi:Zn-dependent protease/predicted transcriptional regulator